VGAFTYLDNIGQKNFELFTGATFFVDHYEEIFAQTVAF
jgi:hypothetical protein